MATLQSSSCMTSQTAPEEVEKSESEFGVRLLVFLFQLLYQPPDLESGAYSFSTTVTSAVKGEMVLTSKGCCAD